MITRTSIPGTWQLDLAPDDKLLLAVALARHPAVPADYHCLTRQTAAAGIPGAERAERLRQESEVAHLEQLKAWVAGFRERLDFSDTESPAQLRLDDDEVERLLQALNEVRIGCWVQLGSPNPLPEPDEPPPEGMARWRLVMELAGDFEARLLADIESESNAAQ